ncbi:hypothetical protein [Methylocapsa aurea]|uniref:hypothetical protein n=1 Tax=Methylocapsa aurea TaxID=663610 RepID=UPI00068D6FB0|nr:hypothetical protein [Methylocapsa aurea]
MIGLDGRVLGVAPPGLCSWRRRASATSPRRHLNQLQGAREALEDLPVRRASRRLLWFLVGAAISAGMTALMTSFEVEMQRNISIAFLIPA